MQTYDFEGTLDADAYSNAVTASHATINDNESRTNSKSYCMFCCYVVLYVTWHNMYDFNFHVDIFRCKSFAVSEKVYKVKTMYNATE